MIDVYLAGPYTHAEESVRRDRFEKLTVVTAELSALGVAVFSPITHSVPLEDTGLIGGLWEQWAAIDEKFVRASRELWVLCLEGWERSTGVNAELVIAQRAGTRVRFVPWVGEARGRAVVYEGLGLGKIEEGSADGTDGVDVERAGEVFNHGGTEGTGGTEREEKREEFKVGKAPERVSQIVRVMSGAALDESVAELAKLRGELAEQRRVNVGVLDEVDRLRGVLVKAGLVAAVLAVEEEEDLPQRHGGHGGGWEEGEALGETGGGVKVLQLTPEQWGAAVDRATANAETWPVWKDPKAKAEEGTEGTEGTEGVAEVWDGVEKRVGGSERWLGEIGEKPVRQYWVHDRQVWGKCRRKWWRV